MLKWVEGAGGKIVGSDEREPDWRTAAVEASGDGVLLTDGERVLDCNEQALRIFRYEDKNELLGRALSSLTPDGHSPLCACDEDTAGAVTGTHSDCLVRGSGEHFTALVAVTPLENGARRFVLWLRDITARLPSAEQEGLLDQTYLRTLFESSPEGIVILDRMGTVLSSNRRFQQMFGYDAAELIGRDIDDLIVPANLRSEAEDLNQAALAGMQAEHQTTRRRKDGSTLLVSILAAPILHQGSLVAFYSIYRDLTPLKETERKLQQTQSRLDAVIHQAPIALFTLDAEGVFTFCAGKALEMAGLRAEEFLGHSAYDLFKDLPEVPTAIGRALSGEHATVVITFRELTYEVQYSPICNSTGRTEGVLGVARDVTETELARRQLEFMAHHDVLTGLPNRALFIDRLQEALNRAKRRKTQLAVLFFDLDRFKHVNDSLGHQSGDRLLQWVARQAREALREVDTVARFGGDEFAVLAEELDSTYGAAIVAQRLLDALNRPYEESDQRIETAASIGISLYPDDGLDPETLLKHADSAMYRAKEGGRGRYEFFSKDMSETAAVIVTKTTWLRRALEHEDFVLHYQPSFSLRDGVLTGVEALIRLRQPDGTLMPPLEFIALAEETGLIIPIGRWVVGEACRQWRRWRSERGLTVRMAVNLSAREFRDRNFVRAIGDTLTASGVPAEHFMVEITESMMFPDPAKARAMLGELKDMQIAVAIDDFGTGYSSLAYLKNFPADYIKIDGSFVAGVPADEKTCGIVRTIISMAKNLALGVIAEGVETEAQYRYLKGLECDEAQGFLLGYPMEAQALGEFLDRRSKPGNF